MAGERHEAEARDIAIWIGALEDQTDRMTPWEVGFLENVGDTFENGTLSPKQIDTLKQIYDRYY